MNYEIRKCEIKHQNKQIITSKLVLKCCAYNIPPPTFRPLDFHPLFLCLSKFKPFRSGPVLSFMFVKHFAHGGCYQEQNTNNDDVVWKLCCAKPGRGHQHRRQRDGVMGRQTVLATEVSPKTGSLQLSVMAGERWAQLGSKRQRKRRQDNWG